MKVRADIDKCIGAGQCVLTAPDAFDQDDEGIVKILQVEPSPEQSENVRYAVSVCPSGAIWLEE